MYDKVSKWIDQVFVCKTMNDVVAIVFNLYEDGDKTWSMEVVGTDCFDEDNPEWTCEEITDFGTRENPFVWKSSKGWEEVLKEISDILSEYLKIGNCAGLLKQFNGIGLGFVDGDLMIIKSDRRV